jgi:hypothetical protein
MSIQVAFCETFPKVTEPEFRFRFRRNTSPTGGIAAASPCHESQIPVDVSFGLLLLIPLERALPALRFNSLQALGASG